MYLRHFSINSYNLYTVKKIFFFLNNRFTVRDTRYAPGAKLKRATPAGQSKTMENSEATMSSSKNSVANIIEQKCKYCRTVV